MDSSVENWRIHSSGWGRVGESEGLKGRRICKLNLEEGAEVWGLPDVSGKKNSLSELATTEMGW